MYGDVPPFMAFPHVRDLAGLSVNAVVVGMPYDGIATFRGGATRRAPQEIRKYSLLYGSYNFDWDLDMLEHIAVADAGDIDVVPGDNAESYARLEARLAAVLAGGAVPLTIGGDHGISYPAVRAVADAAETPVGLIVFDTHLDLSESFGGDRLTRASPLLRISELDRVDPRRIVVIGARGPRNLPEWTPLYRKLGITVFPMEEVERLGIEAVAERARAIATAGGARLYISLDIDGVDPALRRQPTARNRAASPRERSFAACGSPPATALQASTWWRCRRTSTPPAARPAYWPAGCWPRRCFVSRPSAPADRTPGAAPTRPKRRKNREFFGMRLVSSGPARQQDIPA